MPPTRTMCTSGSTMRGADHFDWSAGRRRLTGGPQRPAMAQIPGNPSFYDVLGVSPGATSEEVRAAYRRLSRQTHPDAGGDGALFRLVASAYRTLSDPISRAEYDASLNADVDQKRDAPEWPGECGTALDRSRRRERAGQRFAGGSRTRRVGVGAAFGVAWYLLRATGILSWIVGDAATERPVAAAVEAWARPLSVGRLVGCAVVGMLVAAWRPVVKVAASVAGIRSSIRRVFVGIATCVALLGEHLLTIEGRRVLVLASTLAVVALMGLSRGSRPGDVV